MDNTQSWSSFEDKRRNSHSSHDKKPFSDSNLPSDVVGTDALYVSTSSSSIAPATATLLQSTGLSAAPLSNSEVVDYNGYRNSDSCRQMIDHDEFRLKFHWMRPHPSLLFSVEDKLLRALGESEAEESHEQHSGNEARQKRQEDVSINPAIESSRLMESYVCSMKMNKSEDLRLTTESDCINIADTSNEDDISSKNIQPTADEYSRSCHHLPMEYPKLRINLANLIDPPLMTSWLPGG